MRAAALAVLALLVAAAPAGAAVEAGPVPLDAQPLALDGKAVLFSSGTALWRLERTGPARRVLSTRRGIVLASPTHVAAWHPGSIRAGRRDLDVTVARCAGRAGASHAQPIALDGHHLAYLAPVCDEPAERRLVVVDLDGDPEEELGDIPLDFDPGSVALAGGHALVVSRDRTRVALLNWKLNGLIGEWTGRARHAALAADGSVALCRGSGVHARPPGRPLTRLTRRRCVAPPVALRGGGALAVLGGPDGTQELVALERGQEPRLRARRLATSTAPVVDRGFFTALVPTCNRRPVLLTSLVVAVRPATGREAGPCAARVRSLERRGRSVVAELLCPAGCRGTASLSSDCAAGPPARVRLRPDRTGTIRLPLGRRLATPLRRYRRVRLALQLRLPGGLFRTGGLSVPGEGTVKQPPRTASLVGCEAG